MPNDEGYERYGIGFKGLGFSTSVLRGGTRKSSAKEGWYAQELCKGAVEYADTELCKASYRALQRSRRIRNEASYRAL